MTIEIICDKEKYDFNGKELEIVPLSDVVQFQVTGYADDKDMICFMNGLFEWAKEHKVQVKHKEI